MRNSGKTMPGRSLHASKSGSERAKQALARRSLIQKSLVDEGIASWSTVNKFFTGKPVARSIFLEICHRLDLDWEEIVESPELLDEVTQPDPVAHSDSQDARVEPELEDVAMESESPPSRDQNRRACDRYLEDVLQRLERLGCPEVRDDVTISGRRFNCIARMIDFELGLGMRGEAFFMFSEFAALHMNALKQFSTLASLWAREQVNPSATGRAIYNFRMPAHLCFAIALVDRVEETTAEEIQTTNPFGHSVDPLWYEIPVAYDLSQQRLLYYSKAASFWENFRGEIAWKQLRSVIQQVLIII